MRKSLRQGRRAGLLFLSILPVAGLAVGAATQEAWQAPPDARVLQNPVTGVGEAATVVSTNCTSCHGESGRGDGPAAPALPTKPADWTSARVQGQSDGEIFWKITNGRNIMPSWKHLPEHTRWEIVNYIRTLKRS